MSVQRLNEQNVVPESLLLGRGSPTTFEGLLCEHGSPVAVHDALCFLGKHVVPVVPIMTRR
jgi:hypothetical protein